MIQIDEEYGILKILDINANQVDHKVVKYGLWNRLAAFEEYTDKSQLHESIYSGEILKNLNDRGIAVDDDVCSLLIEIEDLCYKYECSYWRIIDIPFK